jgi:2-succinyl-6-hydroxy-2,4-cyclohexadiene-1-carboxylate synthase
MRLNGLEFHVEIDGSGPPLMLLHGFTGSVRVWDQLRPKLTPRATIIALDLIGHGQTDAPTDPTRYTVDLAAVDLEALLDALGLEKVNLLGYSMGGRLALHFAVRFPTRVRALILESASPGIEDQAERSARVVSDDALGERLLRDGLDAFVDQWERQPLLALAAHVPQAVRDRHHAERLRHSPLGLANSLRGMGAGQQAPLWPRLAELTMPVDLIVGAEDRRYCAIARRMRSDLRRGTLAVVEQAGHTVHLDQPDRFLAIVANALSTPAVIELTTN